MKCRVCDRYEINQDTSPLIIWIDLSHAEFTTNNSPKVKMSIPSIVSTRCWSRFHLSKHHRRAMPVPFLALRHRRLDCAHLHSAFSHCLEVCTFSVLHAISPLSNPLHTVNENRLLNAARAKSYFFPPFAISVLLILLVNPPIYSCNALLSRSNFSCPFFTVSIFSINAANED